MSDWFHTRQNKNNIPLFSSDEQLLKTVKLGPGQQPALRKCWLKTFGRRAGFHISDYKLQDPVTPLVFQTQHMMLSDDLKMLLIYFLEGVMMMRRRRSAETLSFSAEFTLPLLIFCLRKTGYHPKCLPGYQPVDLVVQSQGQSHRAALLKQTTLLTNCVLRKKTSRIPVRNGACHMVFWLVS